MKKIACSQEISAVVRALGAKAHTARPTIRYGFGNAALTIIKLSFWGFRGHCISE
ncbi:MAG: hypothetical protein ACXV8O_18040 [Methylobacter sp.]